MTITALISGIKSAQTVSTSAALFSAAAAARPGAMIVLDTVVAPFTFQPTTSKAAPGVIIGVPAAQVWQIILDNVAGWVTIGGIAAGDLVQGNIAVGSGAVDTNSSVRIKNGCSRIAILGMTLGQGIKSGYVTDSTDVLIKNVLTWGSRDDVFTTQNVQRFMLDGVYSREPAVRNEKMQWYTDGTVPIDINVSNGLPGYGVTNFIADVSHHDVHQPLDGTYNDITIKNVDVEGALQGLWRGGSVIQDLGRSLIDNIRLRCTDPNMISLGGSDLTITNCNVGSHPTYPNPFGTAGLVVERMNSGRVRGYGCSIVSGIGSVTSPSGVDLTSGSMNGDAAASPLSPLTNLAFPSWLPAHAQPAYVARTTAPEIIEPPRIYHTADGGGGTTAPAGTFITVDLAGVLGRETMTGQEWRWTNANVPISGQTGRVLNTTGRTGQAIRCETRVQNAVGGWSGWTTSNLVTIT